MKKKVLFITTRLPYPLNSGTKIVLYNWCKGMKEIYDSEVYVHSFMESDDKKDIRWPDFISNVNYAEQPKFLEKIKNVLWNSIIRKKMPLQVSLYYSKKTHEKILDEINELNPDIVITDMIRTAEYIKNINSNKIIKILEMQDLLSVRYGRQIKNSKLELSVFGQYELANVFKKVINFKFIIKQILKYEKKLLERYEVEISSFYDNIVFVSKLEAKRFNEMAKISKAFAVPLGIDYEFFSAINCNHKKENLICFLGNMCVAHNSEAVEYFINDILPIIKEKIPKVKLRIVGKCTEEYKIRFKGNENIEVTGEVHDIRRYVQECKVSVVPLVYGSGIKTKVLETMAMGVPIVTNDIGAEGIDAVSGEHLFVCNDKFDFANAVNNLLNDEKLSEMLSENAQKFVCDNYQWKKSLTNLSEIFCK